MTKNNLTTFSEIEIDSPFITLGLSDSDISGIANAVSHHLNQSHFISLSLIDKDTMAEINEKFRHQAKPTNVLSFPYPVETLPTNIHKPDVYGEVLLCEDIIKNEAQIQKKDVKSHSLHMILHGILHIHGFDHQDDQEAEAMELLEANILASIDIPNPYEKHVQ